MAMSPNALAGALQGLQGGLMNWYQMDQQRKLQAQQDEDRKLREISMGIRREQPMEKIMPGMPLPGAGAPVPSMPPMPGAAPMQQPPRDPSQLGEAVAPRGLAQTIAAGPETMMRQTSQEVSVPQAGWQDVGGGMYFNPAATFRAQESQMEAGRAFESGKQLAMFQAELDRATAERQEQSRNVREDQLHAQLDAAGQAFAAMSGINIPEGTGHVHPDVVQGVQTGQYQDKMASSAATQAQAAMLSAQASQTSANAANLRAVAGGTFGADDILRFQNNRAQRAEALMSNLYSPYHTVWKKQGRALRDPGDPTGDAYATRKMWEHINEVMPLPDGAQGMVNSATQGRGGANIPGITTPAQQGFGGQRPQVPSFGAGQQQEPMAVPPHVVNAMRQAKAGGQTAEQFAQAGYQNALNAGKDTAQAKAAYDAVIAEWRRQFPD